MKYSLLTNNISGDRSQTEEWSNLLFINPLSLSFSSIWINIHKQPLWSTLCSKVKNQDIYIYIFLNNTHTKINKLCKNKSESAKVNITCFFYLVYRTKYTDKTEWMSNKTAGKVQDQQCYFFFLHTSRTTVHQMVWQGRKLKE